MSKPSMKQICRKTAYVIFETLLRDHWGANGGMSLSDDQVDPFFNHHFQYAEKYFGVRLKNSHRTKIYMMVINFLEIMEEEQIHPEDREELEARLEDLDVEEEAEEDDEEVGASEVDRGHQSDEPGGTSGVSEEEGEESSGSEGEESGSCEVEKPSQEAV